MHAIARYLKKTMENYLYLFLCLSIWYLILVYAFKLTFVNLWMKPRRIEKHFAKQGIRGPKYNFFIGNIKEIVSLAMEVSSQPMTLSHDILPRVLSFYHHWNQIYGSSFLVWFGATGRITIVDPALIKDILIYKSELFEKNESPPLVRKLEGDGLLTLQGDKWALHRKIMAPVFYIENLRLMVDLMEKSIMEMMEKWFLDIITSINTSGKVEIEVSKCFEKLTEDIITRTVFGSSSYVDGKLIFHLQSQQMVYAIEAYNKVFIPGFRFFPTKKHIVSWKLDKQIKNSLMKLINTRKKSFKEDGPNVSNKCPKDLLEVMIKASNQTCVLKQTNSQKECCISSSFSTKITVHDIVEECKTIFFAGKYTTSNLLTWTTVLLAMHPQWQEMAREEVLRVCGARDPPTQYHIANLRTLDLITKESLRLYPPVVAIIRRAKSDVHLGDLSIPSGTELLIPILALHHDKSMWGQDATEFNPARFSKDATKHPMAFMSFGLGGHRCIGQNLAILQAKLTITMILQRFSFHLSPNYKHAPTVLMLLYPQYGAPIIFQKL